MAVPKKRKSHAKGRTRRAHQAITVARNTACPRCGEEKMPHRVCGNCGFYRDREVIHFEEVE